MSDAVVTATGVGFSYGERAALEGVSFSVGTGEIFGFLGPNGSGKTTLFRILSTIVRPGAGEVSVMGMDLVRDRDAVRRRIGVVFQSPSLDKQLTAEENLRHHGHLYGLRGADLRERIEEGLRRFSLIERRRELVQTFSGGMRRRVELAKGMLTRPSVLLMDEPSTGLDPAARIEMWQYLDELRRGDGVTVLLTTHLMDEADRCDRLAIMDGGRIVACDAPAAMKERIGGDVITLTGPDPDAIRRAIRKRHEIDAVVVDGAVRFERARGHEFIPALMESVTGLVDSVSVGRPTLEDVFLHATGRRMGPRVG